ncbi:MAG TPA: DNA-processing protein DprA [Patescibacteria group bacterium]|jgi:DNA processing protein|nr:DNA-processing protein DprA [Patescibacteria group bacterium]
MELETKIYGNALNQIAELGPISLMRLLKYFSDFETAWNAGPKDLALAGLSSKQISAIVAAKARLNPEHSWQQMERAKINMLVAGEKDYPSLLLETAAPPPILYVRGDVKVLNHLAVAVVGTRKMSLYGKRAAQEIVAGLVVNNIAIVSGLAYGIDAEALITTLNNQGRPIAVLASPIDNPSISPRVNYNLAQKIIESGCLVSEYPLGAAVQKQNFPIRNRIIAGLSAGTLVIEADIESGALITAKYALDQNRDVFAVPGSIFSPVSRGTNDLIKQGAKLVGSSFDIIEALNLDGVIETAADLSLEETEDERFVIEYLSHEPTHIDDLIRRVNRQTGKVNAILTVLEMKGRIKNLGGGNYVKLR